MLKAGIALVDISPDKGVQMAGYPHCPRPNIGIHDPLYCGALHLDNGHDSITLVTFDLLYFGKSYCREIREKLGGNITFTTSPDPGPQLRSLPSLPRACTTIPRISRSFSPR